jgi:hypothetical protein
LPACAVVLTALYIATPPVGEGRSSLLRRAIQPRYLVLIVATFVATTWAIYGFDSDPTQPFLKLWRGFNELRWHNEEGHAAYFLGEVRWDGWWYFFPLALILKTPLALLFVGACGGIVLKQVALNWRHWAPLACAITVLLCAAFGRINIGTRHVLAVYAPLCILGGVAIAQLWQSTKWPIVGRIAAATAIVWQVAVSAAAHPDYLAYFNLLAGPEPGRLMADSDLDWGQDIDRLATALRDHEVRHVWLSLHASADLSRKGLPAYDALPAYEPVTGWIAISWTKFDLGCAQPPFDWYCWLDEYQPVASIGKSIRLYRVSNLKEPLSRSGH